MPTGTAELDMYNWASFSFSPLPVRQVCRGYRILCTSSCSGHEDPGARPLIRVGDAGKLNDALPASPSMHRRQDPVAVVEELLQGTKTIQRHLQCFHRLNTCHCNPAAEAPKCAVTNQLATLTRNACPGCPALGRHAWKHETCLGLSQSSHKGRLTTEA